MIFYQTIYHTSIIVFLLQYIRCSKNRENVHQAIDMQCMRNRKPAKRKKCENANKNVYAKTEMIHIIEYQCTKTFL